MMLDQSRFDEEGAGFWFHSGSGDAYQYFQTLRRTGFAEPERKLMLAILDDALRCREKYLYAKDRRGKKLFREAEEWLLSEDDDRVFSFSHVCEVLGYNPSYLRKAGSGHHLWEQGVRPQGRGVEQLRREVEPPKRWRRKKDSDQTSSSATAAR
jgi:hypothetical protein